MQSFQAGRLFCLLACAALLNADGIPLTPDPAISSLNTNQTSKSHASGVFIHVSSGSSQENIASKSKFMYVGGGKGLSRTNETLGKRANSLIVCDKRPEETITRGSFCDSSRGTAGWRAECYTGHVDVGPGGILAYGRSDILIGNHAQYGQCKADQICQDAVSQILDRLVIPHRWRPLAACFDRDPVPEPTEQFSTTLDQVKNPPPVTNPKTAEVSLTDESPEAKPITADWIDVRVLGKQFDDFGNPLTVPLHKGVRCLKCSQLTMRNIPDEMDNLLFNFHYPDGVSSALIELATLS